MMDSRWSERKRMAKFGLKDKIGGHGGIDEQHEIGNGKEGDS